MTVAHWLALYGVTILAASLIGGWLPMLVRLTHARMEMAVSFVAGVMLGVGVLHMIPHAFLAVVDSREAGGSPVVLDHEMAHVLLDPIVLWIVAGFLAMFLIQRFFDFHHHDPPPLPAITDAGSSQPHAPHGDDHHACGHDHARRHQTSTHQLSWVGATVGLTLHSLMEGIALAASIAAVSHSENGEAHVPMWAGLGTFLVIVLHKPLDAMTITTLMTTGGHHGAMRHVVNAAFSLLVPIGAMLFHVAGSAGGGLAGGTIVSAALAFSAGTFLCIAMSDLLPELQFHKHDRFKLSACLIVGLAMAWGIGKLEQGTHSHGHGHEHAELDHAHHDHEH